MNPAIAALLAIEPKPLPGVALLARLYANGPASVEELLEAGPEIEAEMKAANELATHSKEAIERCLKLKPASLPHIPTGF